MFKSRPISRPSRRSLSALLLTGLLFNTAVFSAPSTSDWSSTLDAKLKNIEQSYPGNIGVYVKDLQTGQSYSFKAEEHWYLASMVKVPVAIAVMRAVERGELALDQRLPLLSSDYVDGAGQTNWHGPGERLTVDWLISQMLINSDNTATDVLIRQIGLDAVNHVVAELAPGNIETITRLADVRRHVYSHYHRAAFELVGRQFLTLRQQSTETERRQTLARLLKVPAQEIAQISYHQAFDRYYSEGLNSGALTAYGLLLERFFRGEALQAESTQYLLSTMGKVATGRKRLRNGLPKGVALAHKTGTQYGRFCDAGIAQTGEGDIRHSVIIATCTRGDMSMARSEKAISDVGRAIGMSGVLSAPITVGEASR
ncbi:serine hydrolase [Pseudomonas matsuisoli]|uniref:Beta-lactamase n=1 Tax=Pseudomonas matsuisoli TaxID=1515666 RepID=A0A917PYN7_9PSED|nr:serine hydrolase [Pseudomonas matsuisoli]GGJ99546.1 beta-lactamase [Pseudomonas matsuisoli]